MKYIQVGMDQENKVVLITGSTDGIGKRAAELFLVDGWHVVVHGRIPERVGQTRAYLAGRYDSSRVYGLSADLSSLNEIRDLAEELSRQNIKIDLLLNNAGVIQKQFELTSTGLEKTFAVNHLGHFFLSGLLLPMVRKQGSCVEV